MYYPTVCSKNVMAEANRNVDAYFARCATRKLKPCGTRDSIMEREMTNAHVSEQMGAMRQRIAGDKVAMIRAAQNDLSNKDRWTQADYAKNDQLTRDLRVALQDIEQ